MMRSKAVLALAGAGAGILIAFSGAIAQMPELPEGPGKEIVSQNCSACHGLDLITARRRSPQEWEELVNRMIGNGASLTDEQYKGAVAYLGTYLGTPPASGTAPAQGAAPVPAKMSPAAPSTANTK